MVSNLKEKKNSRFLADNVDTLDKMLEEPESLGRSITRENVLPLTTCAITELILYRSIT